MLVRGEGSERGCVGENDERRRVRDTFSQINLCRVQSTRVLPSKFCHQEKQLFQKNFFPKSNQKKSSGENGREMK
jgi:hypothetical protein